MNVAAWKYMIRKDLEPLHLESTKEPGPITHEFHYFNSLRTAMQNLLRTNFCSMDRSVAIHHELPHCTAGLTLYRLPDRKELMGVDRFTEKALIADSDKPGIYLNFEVDIHAFQKEAGIDLSLLKAYRPEQPFVAVATYQSDGTSPDIRNGMGLTILNTVIDSNIDESVTERSNYCLIVDTMAFDDALTRYMNPPLWGNKVTHVFHACNLTPLKDQVSTISWPAWDGAQSYNQRKDYFIQKARIEDWYGQIQYEIDNNGIYPKRIELDNFHVDGKYEVVVNKYDFDVDVNKYIFSSSAGRSGSLDQIIDHLFEYNDHCFSETQAKEKRALQYIKSIVIRNFDSQEQIGVMSAKPIDGYQTKVDLFLTLDRNVVTEDLFKVLASYPSESISQTENHFIFKNLTSGVRDLSVAPRKINLVRNINPDETPGRRL